MTEEAAKVVGLLEVLLDVEAVSEENLAVEETVAEVDGALKVVVEVFVVLVDDSTEVNLATEVTTLVVGLLEVEILDELKRLEETTKVFSVTVDKLLDSVAVSGHQVVYSVTTFL